MFSLLNALTLTRLPIAAPDDLIAINPINSRGLPRSTPMSAVDVLRDGPLDPLCAYMGGIVLPILANGTPIETLTTFVTGQCFEALGVRPIVGRAITEADAPIYSPGARVAVISHRLWTRVFGSDQNVLGRTLQVNNVDVEIVGVLPQGFIGLEVDHGVDVFAPFDTILAAGPTRRQLASFLLGRLRPGTTLAQATAEIETRWPALLEAVVPADLAPSEFEQLRDSSPRLERMGTGTSRNRERYVRPLTLILGLTSVLLLLACVNLGGLLLARVTARSSELSVRLALGGTRRRIAQQMVIESLLLAIAGAALALPLAYAIAATLPTFLPPANVPYAMSFTPDARVLAVTAAIGLAVGVVMSAIPVWMAMRRSSHTFTWDRTVVGSTSRWVRGLLVAQVALSVVLVLGSTMLVRSLYLLQTGDLGVRTRGIVNVKAGPMPNGSYNRGDRESYFPALLERVAALPGVQSASLARVFPRATATPGTGMPVAFVGDEPTGLMAQSDYVSPEFFETMGMRLLAGTGLSWADTLETRPVAVISESLARALAPDGNVLERRIRLRTMPVDQEMVVIGVVSDATLGNPRDAHPHVAWRPALQMSAISAFSPSLLIATTDPATAASGVRQILGEFGRDYAQEILGLPDLLARAPVTERMSATVAGAVGGLAVVLALVGIHGAFAYAVSRRRREIGVRLAMGATPSIVARGVVRDALVLTLLGVAVGLPLAAGAARSLRSLLFGITEGDVATYGAVGVFFLVLGAAAVLLPARRAAGVDPATALRTE